MPSVRRTSAASQNVTRRQAATRSAAGSFEEVGAGDRDKLLQAQENRTQYQIEAISEPAPTYYAGGNRVEPLGANNPIRPRSIQANAALGVGDRECCHA